MNTVSSGNQRAIVRVHQSRLTTGSLFSSPRHGGVGVGPVSQRVQRRRSCLKLLALEPLKPIRSHEAQMNPSI
jgi:hypothetical protein